MKKIFMACLICASIFALSGCEKRTEEASSNFILPEGMKDCVIYKMNNESGIVIYAIRCPLSTTTTTMLGKVNSQVVVTEEKTKVETKVETAPVKPKEEIVVNGKHFIEK